MESFVWKDQDLNVQVIKISIIDSAPVDCPTATIQIQNIYGCNFIPLLLQHRCRCRRDWSKRLWISRKIRREERVVVRQVLWTSSQNPGLWINVVDHTYRNAVYNRVSSERQTENPFFEREERERERGERVRENGFFCSWSDRSDQRVHTIYMGQKTWCTCKTDKGT